MATDSAVKAVTNTFSTTVADAITLTQGWPFVAITNHDASNPVYVRFDGTTPVAEADNNAIVRVSSTRVFPVSPNSSGQIVIGLVGSGGKYTVEGLNAPALV